MTKVVYNDDFGGFGLSEEGMKYYKELKGIPLDTYVYSWDMDRTDLDLVKTVEDLGKKAGCDLAIAEIPEGSRYRIDEYDGNESVMCDYDYDWTVA